MVDPFFLKKSFDVVNALVGALRDIRKKRQAEIDSIESMFGDLDNLVPYYVVPDAQNMNPADLAEDDTGLVARTNAFDLISAFLGGSRRFSHTFILSDAGMGKSSLLVMLAVSELGKFVNSDFRIKLFKLGPDTLDAIEKIEAPNKTVLLLDALDEDAEAWGNFYGRVQSVLKATSKFRKVIITCRTQFFPREHEEDGRVPGQVVLGGFHCSKLFLSPFTDSQVSLYLEHRFQDPVERARAADVVRRMSSLKFRPMLLSYVDYLIEDPQSYDNAFSIYKSLVDEWLNRELRKGVVAEKGMLRLVCATLAVYMYKTKAQELEPALLSDLTQKIDARKTLEAMTIEGRSLLHRNSRGAYKFAHYSILEYFVAEQIVSRSAASSDGNSDQIVAFIADMIAHHGLRDLAGFDLHGMVLTDVGAPRANFKDCNLQNAIFDTSRLAGSSFLAARGDNISLTGCDLSDSDLSRVFFPKASFMGARLTGATLTESDLTDSRLQEAELSNATITDSVFDHADGMSLIASGVQCTRSRFVDGGFADSIWKNSEIARCQFDGCQLDDSMWPHAKISDSTFANSRLAHADLSNSELTKTHFNGAHLKAANFKCARIINGTFSGAMAEGANFEGVVLETTSFENADLSGATFADAFVQACAFDNADITGAILTGDFKDCTWKGAWFDSATRLPANIDPTQVGMTSVRVRITP